LRGGKGGGSFWKVLGLSRIFVRSYFDTVLAIARAMAVFRRACSENIVYSFVVGRVTYSDVIAFVELVFVERACGAFVRRLPDFRFGGR